MSMLATHLSAWAGAGWGLAGGFCVEALWLHSQIRSARGRWSWRRPIPQGLTAYVISVLARVGVGGLVAAAAAGSGRVSSTLVAFGLGVGAPLAVEKLAQAVPLTGHLPSSPDPRPAIAEPSPQTVIAEPSPQAVPAEPNLSAAVTEHSPNTGAAERSRPVVIAEEVGDAG